MKFVDRSPELARPERDSFFGRVRGSMKHGLSWTEEMEAQQTCIRQLTDVLGDEYTLLQNFPLDGLDIPIPLVLVGPAGLFVIQVTSQTGSFLAKEEKWLSLANPHYPRPVKPNLLVRSALMAQALDDYLAKNGGFAPKALPVLVCTNPHMAVERVRPIVRVVQCDSMEYFAEELVKGVRLISPQILCETIEWLAPPWNYEATAWSATAELKPYPAPTQVEEHNSPESEPPHKFAFSRGQQIALGVMVILEVIALVIILILITRAL